MKFGYFDDKFREYVITNPRTPVKWINYIGSLQFGGFVDHTGGALICKDDPTFNRITRYIQQLPSSDFKGETLYLRIGADEERLVFSPFFVPTLTPYQKFECRVGLGYTRIISEIHNIRTEVTIFVPVDELCEIRDIRITNLGDLPVAIDVIPVVEFSHPDALKQFTNADWVPQTMVCQAVDDDDFKVLVEYPFMNRDSQINYFTSNWPAASFETERKRFLGENEYGSFKMPFSLLEPELSSLPAWRGDNVAVLMHHAGLLKPGLSFRLITQLGQAASLAVVQSSIESYRRSRAVENALAKIARFWDKYLSALQVTTPDESMNTMLNIYNPHQCYITRTWSRYLSYYQPGLGARGIGIRDSSQDVMAVFASEPDESRHFLKTLLSFQKQDGSAMHQFNPLTMEGDAGDAREMENRPHFYSDDHLWTILAVIAYLKESGDFDFFNEIIPFYDKDRRDKYHEQRTLTEHLERGLSFTRENVGRHGLPLLGFADWNDTVNLPTGAESLFTANLYGLALREVINLFKFVGLDKRAAYYQAAYDEMKARVESTAWDGQWYLRYFDDKGQPVGSSQNEYGQIYLNGQTWPVISGFASAERARIAMDSVFTKLNTKYGIKLSTPGYNGYDPQFGGVTTYPPGAKENGGIFVHPNPWATIAESILGNGGRAYQYYAQINPATKNDLIEVYECEPYVYAQNILGDEHPQFGLARNAWLTGAASWSYQAGTQWILGIRPEFAGLRIDPCIPEDWEGFKAVRHFRSKTIQISVHNPNHVCKGVTRMVVDGQVFPGNLVPANLPDSAHSVELWLG